MNIRLKIAIFALGLALTGTIQAGRLETDQRVVDAEEAERIQASIEFAAGELSIAPYDIKEAAILDVKFDSRKIDYDVSYSLRGKTGILDMESVQHRHRDLDTEDNAWQLQLSTRYPLTLDMEIGACEAELELGGLPLTELSIEIGAASGIIMFSKVNPQTLEQISIEAGAASVEIIDIGNASFEFFEFDGGAGSFELDFRGKAYTGDAQADIDIGFGSCKIILPRGLAVQIMAEDDGWLSSVDFHGNELDEVDDDLWETDDFNTAKATLTLEIDVGMGSVDVYWK